MRLFTILLVVLMSAFVSANEDITNLVKGLAGAAIRQEVDRAANRDIDASVTKINFERNRENEFRFPEKSVLGFEVKSNRTRFDDEKLLAVIKAQVKYWGKGLGVGPSFKDREELRERNAADRSNEELRNPTQKGRAERPAYDVQITAREASGSDLKGGDFGRWWSKIFGRYETKKSFVELTIEIVEAETRVAPADGIFAVIGGNLKSSRLEVDARNFGFRSESENDSDQDLRDAAKRLTQVLTDEKRGR